MTVSLLRSNQRLLFSKWWQLSCHAPHLVNTDTEETEPSQTRGGTYQRDEMWNMLYRALAVNCEDTFKSRATVLDTSLLVDRCALTGSAWNRNNPFLQLHPSIFLSAATTDYHTEDSRYCNPPGAGSWWSRPRPSESNSRPKSKSSLLTLADTASNCYWKFSGGSPCLSLQYNRGP